MNKERSKIDILQDIETWANDNAVDLTLFMHSTINEARKFSEKYLTPNIIKKEETKMKLKVKFIRYKNFVICDILEQKGIDKGIFKMEKKGYEITSLQEPDLYEKELCLRGTESECDHVMPRHFFSTEESAIEAVKIFTEMINEINYWDDVDKNKNIDVSIAG